MRNTNQNFPYHHSVQPPPQPMYYQPHQDMYQSHYGYNQPYQRPPQPMQQNFMQNPFPMPNVHQMPQQMSQQLPQQPMFYPPNRPQTQQLGGMGPSFPYPKQKQGKKQPSQTQNIFSQFKSPDGNYDINKMLNTAGTMVNTVNQITGMVKQVGGFFVK